MPYFHSRQEIKEGADILRKKLALYKPKIAVFNGKGKWCQNLHVYFFLSFMRIVVHYSPIKIPNNYCFSTSE